MDPIVGWEDESLMTWMFPLKYQLPNIPWSDSAEATSSVILCVFPSARIGRNVVKSILYVGWSKEP
jgi:hypothetical protein